jgi:phage-related minor tail protein
VQLASIELEAASVQATNDGLKNEYRKAEKEYETLLNTFATVIVAYTDHATNVASQNRQVFEHKD